MVKLGIPMGGPARGPVSRGRASGRGTDSATLNRSLFAVESGETHVVLLSLGLCACVRYLRAFNESCWSGRSGCVCSRNSLKMKLLRLCCPSQRREKRSEAGPDTVASPPPFSPSHIVPKPLLVFCTRSRAGGQAL